MAHNMRMLCRGPWPPASTREYQAVCIAGYNSQGFLPNWHRLSDNLENIEPEPLERVANYTWALAQEVDCIENGVRA
jgi:hypothetical protein